MILAVQTMEDDEHMYSVILKCICEERKEPGEPCPSGSLCIS